MKPEIRKVQNQNQQKNSKLSTFWWKKVKSRSRDPNKIQKFLKLKKNKYFWNIEKPQFLLEKTYECMKQITWVAFSSFYGSGEELTR